MVRVFTYFQQLIFGVLISLMVINISYASLIAEKTRIIYTKADKSQTLNIKNMGNSPILVQSWVDDGGGNPYLANAPFIVDPVTLYLAPNQIKNISVIYTGDNLPLNFESVFWLNLYEVTASNKQNYVEQDANKITLNFNTQLKIFYRPDVLNKELDVKKLSSNIDFKLNYNIKDNIISNLELTSNNLSLYNVSFANIVLNIKNLSFNIMDDSNFLLKPKSSNLYAIDLNNKKLTLQDLNNAQIIFYIIDDYGNSHQFITTLNV